MLMIWLVGQDRCSIIKIEKENLLIILQGYHILTLFSSIIKKKVQDITCILWWYCSMVSLLTVQASQMLTFSKKKKERERESKSRIKSEF
jgi:bacteriorhodopsin